MVSVTRSEGCPTCKQVGGGHNETCPHNRERSWLPKNPRIAQVVKNEVTTETIEEKGDGNKG